jgi:hypothetical protein
MPKKPVTSSRKIESAPAKASFAKAPVSTPVRNSAIPKMSTASTGPVEINRDQIARRAYFIHLSGNGGSEADNWFQAERELRAGR